MHWEEKSWPEMKALDKDIPVVIPLGSCEQHGHHLPVFVDTIQVTAVAERVEEILGESVLMVPPIWLGTSHHHKDFPGTISLKPSLYSEVIMSVADSIMRAGFRRLFFLNGHGGNEIPACHALTEMVAERDDADEVYLTFGTWWKVAVESLHPEKHGLETPRITHACEIETSFMLYLRPDLVHTDRIKEGNLVLDSPWFNSDYGGRVEVFRRFHRLTPPGNMGKPTVATAEKGQSMLNAVATDVVAYLKELAGWPELPVVKDEG